MAYFGAVSSFFKGVARGEVRDWARGAGAALARLALVMPDGWMQVSRMHGSISGLFWVVAASMLLFGAIIAASFRIKGRAAIR